METVTNDTIDMSTFRIKIENPCGQKWEQMTPAGIGKFCEACSKVVVDFNSMSDRQIAEYLKSQSRSVCGRISKTRMQTAFHAPDKNNSIFNFTLLRYSLAGLLTFVSLKGAAQKKENKQEQLLRDNTGKQKKDAIKKDESLIIKKYASKKGGTLVVNVRTREGKLNNENTTITVVGENWEKVFKGITGKVVIADSLMNGTITVQVSSPGYSWWSATIDLSKNGMKPVLAELKKEEIFEMGVIVPYND